MNNDCIGTHRKKLIYTTVLSILRTESGDGLVGQMMNKLWSLNGNMAHVLVSA